MPFYQTTCFAGTTISRNPSDIGDLIAGVQAKANAFLETLAIPDVRDVVTSLDVAAKYDGLAVYRIEVVYIQH